MGINVCRKLSCVKLVEDPGYILAAPRSLDLASEWMVFVLFFLKQTRSTSPPPGQAAPWRAVSFRRYL
jgi:hypothetical protein